MGLKIYRQLEESYPDKSFIVISGNKIAALTQITEAIQLDMILFMDGAIIYRKVFLINGNA